MSEYYSASGSRFRVSFKNDCSVWFRIQRIIKKCLVYSAWFTIQKVPAASEEYYSATGSRFRVLFKIRPAASGSGFSVLLKNVKGIIQRLVHDSGYTIQGIIENTTCSVCFSIQRIIKKCPGYYSASGSRFRVLFKIRPAAFGSGFSVLLKNVHGIIQRLVHDSRYYSKYDLQRLVRDSAYYSKVYRILFSIWFTIQDIIQNMTCSAGSGFRLIQKKCPGYYSATGSVFSVLFNIRPAASGSGFSVLLKNVQGIIQRMVHDSGYYSKYDLQHLVQDSAYY